MGLPWSVIIKAQNGKQYGGLSLSTMIHSSSALQREREREKVDANGIMDGDQVFLVNQAKDCTQ